MLDQLPPTLVDKSGTHTATQQVLKDKKVLAFYFSAHWCPPCSQYSHISLIIQNNFNTIRTVHSSAGPELRAGEAGGTRLRGGGHLRQQRQVGAGDEELPQ